MIGDRPIDRIELPPGINRAELLADIESMRSLLRTGYELRSNPRREHIARTIKAAEALASMIMGDKVAPEARLGIGYIRFRQNVLNLIDELKKDHSPAVVELLDIDQNISQFENMIDMIADRYRHYFDAEPGASTNPYTAEVGGPFIRFTGALLEELGLYKEDTPYTPAGIRAALKKLRRRV